MVMANKSKKIVSIFLFLIWALLLHFALIKVSGKDNSKAIIASLTFFLGLIALFKLYKESGSPIFKALFGIVTLCIALFYSIIAVAFSYTLKTQSPISAADINALFQTNVGELIDFLVNSFFTPRLTILFIFVFLFTILIYKFLLSSLKPLQISTKIRTPLLLFAICLLCFGFLNFRTTTNIIKLKKDYDTSIKGYKSLKDRYSKNEPLVYDAQKKNKGELYILVIGESASRDRMHLYGALSKTTPWLDSVANEGGWVVLKNAYSPHTHTVPSLLTSLKEQNAYSNTKFPDTSTVLSLSTYLNFKTTWLSNQIQQGIFDNPISALGETSDVSIFANNALSSDLKSIPPDEVIIPLFKKQLETLNLDENNLIVVHLFGSHGKYEERYPKSFNKIEGISKSAIGKMFDKKIKADLLISYETSILYTDSVLKEMFKALQQTMNCPIVFIYFSDHGEEPTGNNHQSSEFTWTMARIPFVVWMSDEYRKLYPERANNLKANEDKIYTNDLFFNLFAGLANIEYKNNTPQLDISSKDYNLSGEQASILSGKFKIADDPFWAISSNMKLFASKNGKLAAHRCNSTFIQNDAINLGATRLEMDITLQQGEPSRLLLGHDEESMSDTELGMFLEHHSKDISYLWLDMKNLNAETAPEILAQLTALDQKYQLKNRCLVETGYPNGATRLAQAGWKTSYYLPWNDLATAYKDNDSNRLDELSKTITGRVKENNFASISYDLEADAAVLKAIYPLLGDSVEYNAWETDWNFKDKDLADKIAKHPHLKTILIHFTSDFKL